jgi:hypothetical protein
MSTDGKPTTGDQCPAPNCKGHLFVETSRIVGNTRRQFLKCDTCGENPPDHIRAIPLEYAPPRKSRRTSYL